MHRCPQRRMGVDVPVAVQVRECDARLHHSIDLRRALSCDLGRVHAADTRASNKEGQGIELAGLAPSERRRRGKRFARCEIEVKTERERRTGSRPRHGVIEARQVHHHRSGCDDTRLCCLDYSGIYAARESVVVGVYDEPSGATRRSHAHRFGARGSGPSTSRHRAWQRRSCSARRCSESRQGPARSRGGVTGL